MEFSELFVFASFRIVQFSNFGNFSEISFLFELAKISLKYFGNIFLFLGQLTLFLSQKTLFLGQKVWKQGFPNIWNLQKIWNLFYSKLSENYTKMTLKLNFGNCKKLVPTRKPTRMFSLKFGMQGLMKLKSGLPSPCKCFVKLLPEGVKF